MYTVIGPTKTRAFRVVWMLEELGERYELDASMPQSKTARAHNPSGKVPILLEDGTAITDSTAIMTYLADKHGKLTSPAGTLERAQQDAMTHVILDELDAVLWTAARHSFILPENMRVPKVKDSLKWEFGESLKRIAGRMKGTWATGEAFTLTDIVLAHCLMWAHTAKFTVSDPDMLAYLARAADRPAYQRASVKT